MQISGAVLDQMRHIASTSEIAHTPCLAVLQGANLFLVEHIAEEALHHMTADRRAKDLDTNVLVVAVVVAAVLSAVSLDRRTARQVWAEEGAGSLHCGGMQFGWVARMATAMSVIVTL